METVRVDGNQDDPHAHLRGSLLFLLFTLLHVLQLLLVAILNFAVQCCQLILQNVHTHVCERGDVRVCTCVDMCA